MILNEQASARTLGCARIVVYALCLTYVHTVHLEDLSAIPDELLSRWGLLYLIPLPVFEMLTGEVFGVAFRAVLTALLTWLILGLPGYRPVAIATAILLTLFDGLGKSLGHINHAQFAMLYATWILAAFPAADAVALRRGPPPRRSPAAYSAPMVAIALMICTAYMFIGAFRFDRGGLELFTSDTLRFWFIRRSVEHNPTGFTFGFWVAANPLVMFLAQVGFLVGTVLELLSPLCFVSRYFRWFWIAYMVVFHILNLYTMNINFWHNAVLILFFMTDIDRIIAPGAARERFAWLAGALRRS